MEDKLLVNLLQNELTIGGKKADSYEDMKGIWASYFNGLIHDDFPGLLRLFYRIDVSEDKLRRILKENPDENAGLMIASLVIERLMQKIKSREEFRSKPDMNSSDPDADIW